MQSFSNLLKRFKNLTPPDGIIREAVSKVLMEQLGVEIPVQKIQIRSKVVFLQENNIIKSQVFLKKKILLQELQKVLEKQAPKDIR
ncbi:MAG TPA: hypothetical protein VFM02_04085 [Candidatus Paceibacterota bacterium]|nr:hypothetical protein [Candidatus Paceibacterota bacterium]